jgi:ABC-2 type transport system permease protein
VNQLRAELLKIRSTRTTIGLLVGLVVLALLFTVLACIFTPSSQLFTEQDQSSLLSFGSVAGVFAALAGVMLFTSEYRFGTIRPTSLFNPNRAHLFASKVTAGVISGFIFGVIGEGLVFSIGMVILKIRGVPIVMSGANMTELIVGAIIGTAVWGAIGVGLGSIVTNQVGAVIVLLAWGFVVENLVFGFLPKVGRFLPVHSSDAMMGPIQDKLLPGNVGTLVTVAWALVLAVVGIALLKRRDVS